MTSTGSTDGCHNLYHLLTLNVPKLGYAGYNVDDKVKELKVVLDKTLAEFLTLAKTTHETILIVASNQAPLPSPDFY